MHVKVDLSLKRKTHDSHLQREHLWSFLLRNIPMVAFSTVVRVKEFVQKLGDRRHVASYWQFLCPCPLALTGKVGMTSPVV